MKLFRIKRQDQPHSDEIEFRWKQGTIARELVDCLFEWGGLHRIFRSGWVDRGADLPEWDLDHSSLVSLAAANLALYLERPKLKPGRCGLLGKVHDWGEKVDHTPHENLAPRNARRRRRFFQKLPSLSEPVILERRRLKNAEEEATMRTRTSLLAPALGQFYYHAWDEYRCQETKKARFVHQVHALVDCVRATLYKSVYPKEEFRTFFDTARKVITDPFLLTLVAEIETRYLECEQEGKRRTSSETDPEP